MTWKTRAIAAVAVVALAGTFVSLIWLGRVQDRQRATECRQAVEFKTDIKNAAYASLTAQEAVLDELFSIHVEANPEVRAQATLARARVQGPLEVFRRLIDEIDTTGCGVVRSK